MLSEEPINAYVDWLLGVVLAVRSTPSTVYDGVSFAVAHAIRLEKEKINAC
jgi:hypothetical protein